ncbi:MAG TPA: hypothetical protein VII36_11565 [Usitatibacter sp.]
MKNILAVGLACCLPIGLAAEDSNTPEAFLGTMNVLMVEESAPPAQAGCVPGGNAEGPGCPSFNRAVLIARIQKVSVLHERGRWM